MKKIGLIAGNGQFPVLFAKKARERGYEVYTVAHLGETEQDLDSHVTAIKWIRLGQIKRLLNFFKSAGVKEAVFLGGIAKSSVFKNLRPDIKAISLLAGLDHTHDDAVLRALAGLLEKEGISIQPSTFLLPEILAEKGCWTKRRPKKSEKADMKLGWRIAKEIGRLDIGQCVVVDGGSVLAVEAIDGTDATIKRGGALGGGSSVVVKVCKPNQDFRFDVPAVGPETIRSMEESGVGVLVIEAGKAVAFEKEEMIKTANKAKISILALEENPGIFT